MNLKFPDPSLISTESNSMGSNGGNPISGIPEKEK